MKPTTVSALLLAVAAPLSAASAQTVASATEVVSAAAISAAEAAGTETQGEPSAGQVDPLLAQAEVEGEGSGDAEVTIDLDAEGEEGLSAIHPFSVSLTISNSASIGAIFRDANTVTNYDLLSFGFGVGYETPVDGLSLSLDASYSKFLTEAGGSTFVREGRFGDIGVGASWAFYTWEATGLSFSASAGFSLPTSDVSRFTNLYTSTSLGLGVSRAFGDLRIAYRIGAGKDFHRDTTVVADLSDYQLQVLARDGGIENIGEAQVALDTGVLPEWSLSHNLSLSYSWFTGFSTSIGFGFSDFWTYDNGTITQRDEFTSPLAVVGRGHGQSMRGSLSASYAFLDYFSAGLSFTTSQQPLTADNRRVRFPFWDLETGNLQNTSVSLSLSASY